MVSDGETTNHICSAHATKTTLALTITVWLTVWGEEVDPSADTQRDKTWCNKNEAFIKAGKNKTNTGQGQKLNLNSVNQG